MISIIEDILARNAIELGVVSRRRRREMPELTIADERERVVYIC